MVTHSRGNHVLRSGPNRESGFAYFRRAFEPFVLNSSLARRKLKTLKPGVVHFGRHVEGGGKGPLVTHSSGNHAQVQGSGIRVQGAGFRVQV